MNENSNIRVQKLDKSIGLLNVRKPSLEMLINTHLLKILSASATLPYRLRKVYRIAHKDLLQSMLFYYGFINQS